MKAQAFINELRSHGRFSFTTEDAEKRLELEKVPCLNALHRLKKHNLIVSPAKGFYLIIPPEYQVYGCLPANMFIPDLMKYWRLPYYAGFLSAAQFYGAAHQKPQRFQIVTLKNRLPIQCGRIYVEFIANKHLESFPTKSFNTMAGTISVASPEVLAADLVSKPKYAAGISNVATILDELAEQLNMQKLIELTLINTELFWVQRLGWLLEFLGFTEQANALFKTLSGKKLYWVRLLSSAPYKPSKQDEKWHIIINTDVEPD